MNLQIPETTAFDGNMSNGDTIQLPFVCPPFFVLNGQAAYEESKDARFFGGWACSNERLKEGAEEWGIEYPPRFIKPVSLVIKKNQRLEAHISRFLHIGVIGFRQFSTIRDEANNVRRVAPFTKGARPAIQVLALLGYKQSKEDPAFHPYMPVMLTAGGYQVGHLRNAITTWAKAIKSLYKPANLKPNTFTGFFYNTIGTSGDHPQFEDHGESSITPIRPIIPDGFNEGMLEQRYVGTEIANWMIDLSQQAQEWLHAFDAMAHNASAQDGPMIDSEPQYNNEAEVY